MIYVITHKVFNTSILEPDLYRVLHVGNNDCCREDWLRDDTGDHITEKNDSYCELTGLYWIWKNAAESDHDITGLVHYRRYFTTEAESRKYQRRGIMPSVLTKDEVLRSLIQCDIILPNPQTTVENVYHTYRRMHYSQDLDLAGQCVHRMDPSYDAAFQQVMHAHHLSYANMFLSHRDVLNAYCTWLFPILFEVEQHQDNLHKGSPYQRRVIGFLGERLLNVWVRSNKLAVHYYPVFNTEEREKTPLQTAACRVQTLFQVAAGKQEKRMK